MGVVDTQSHGTSQPTGTALPRGTQPSPHLVTFHSPLVVMEPVVDPGRQRGARWCREVAFYSSLMPSEGHPRVPAEGQRDVSLCDTGWARVVEMRVTPCTFLSFKKKIVVFSFFLKVLLSLKRETESKWPQDINPVVPISLSSVSSP